MLASASALEILSLRLKMASRAPMPSAPATRFLRLGPLEETMEQRLCNEMIARRLEERRPQSLLVVDAATTGGAAARWLVGVLPLFDERAPGSEITLVLPSTRWTGRGRLLSGLVERAAADSSTKLDVRVCWGECGLSVSGPVEDEAEKIREHYDLIIVLGLAGMAGLDAPWPIHPAKRWLRIADAAVFSFIDPDSIPADLPLYATVDPAPLRFRVETLDTESPEPLDELSLEDLEKVRIGLPHAIESARKHPWRLVIRPRAGHHGTPLGCYSDTSARRLLSPLEVERALVTGRRRVVVARSAS